MRFGFAATRRSCSPPTTPITRSQPADDVLLMMPGGREVHGAVADMIEPGHLSELYGVPMRWVDVLGPNGETRRAILPAFAGKEVA